jgi:integrase
MEKSPPKSDAGRRVINREEPILIDSLRRQRARQNERRLEVGALWRDHDLVFCSEVGTPVFGSNLWRQYKKIVEKAGVPHISIYGMRHTVATLLTAAGWSVNEVA